MLPVIPRFQRLRFRSLWISVSRNITVSCFETRWNGSQTNLFLHRTMYFGIKLNIDSWQNDKCVLMAQTAVKHDVNTQKNEECEVGLELWINTECVYSISYSIIYGVNFTLFSLFLIPGTIYILFVFIILPRKWEWKSSLKPDRMYAKVDLKTDWSC